VRVRRVCTRERGHSATRHRKRDRWFRAPAVRYVGWRVHRGPSVSQLRTIAGRHRSARQLAAAAAWPLGTRILRATGSTCGGGARAGAAAAVSASTLLALAGSRGGSAGAAPRCRRGCGGIKRPRGGLAGHSRGGQHGIDLLLRGAHHGVRGGLREREERRQTVQRRAVEMNVDNAAQVTCEPRCH